MVQPRSARDDDCWKQISALRVASAEVGVEKYWELNDLILSLGDASREMLGEAHAKALERFRTAVRPVYGVTSGGDPDHIGSAVLLDLDGKKCLLTAAHVLDHNDETTLYLGGDGFHLMAFEALVTVAPGGDRKADAADFAVAVLSDSDVRSLTSASFITRPEISVHAGSSEGRSFVCLGYPNSQNKTNRYKSTRVTPKLGNYTSSGRAAGLLPDIADERDHVLVDFDPKFSRDRLGNKVASIRMNGFSGGAIVDLGHVTPEGLSHRSDPKLAAVLIELHSGQKVILGTRVTAILQSIEGKL